MEQLLRQRNRTWGRQAELREESSFLLNGPEDLGIALCGDEVRYGLLNRATEEPVTFVMYLVRDFWSGTFWLSLENPGASLVNLIIMRDRTDNRIRSPRLAASRR